MTDRELMQQALEALEGLADISWSEAFKQRKYDSDEPEENIQRECVLGAITALRERLARQEQEPVAWGCSRYIEDDNGFQIGTDEPELAWGKFAPDDNGWWPLYTAPQRREWVGLTEEEIAVICGECAASAHRADDISYARAIEAKLRGKNT